MQRLTKQKVYEISNSAEAILITYQAAKRPIIFSVGEFVFTFYPNKDGSDHLACHYSTNHLNAIMAFRQYEIETIARLVRAAFKLRSV